MIYTYIHTHIHTYTRAHIYVTINMKMVPNVQTDFERTFANKLLLCGHLEQEVIKIQPND